MCTLECTCTISIVICINSICGLICFCSDDDPFTFLPPELEPKIPPKQQQRAKKAIKHVVSLTSKDTEEEKKGCCERLNCCRKRKDEKQVEEEKVTPSTELSPEMQKASNQGLSMVKSIIFPSLPALLQDLWVYLELAISIVAFALGLLDTFPIKNGLAFNYTYFVLTAISMILALIDAYIYFIQLGSCARGIRVCRRKLKERGKPHEELEEEEEEEVNDDDENGEQKYCRLNKKWKQRFSTWFELGRNILTELFLYPLLIFDMFDFITDAGYQPEGAVGQAGFSLFVIGGFYLILSVYIMRIFMVAGSMISLIRIPTNKAATGNSSDTSFLVKFCAHVLGQIIVHLMVILVIATKINNENRESENSMNMTFGTMMMNMSLTDSGDEEEGFNINASPFLITAIVLGGIIPLAGVSAFFVANYYWMKEFSIGFWLNMISLLQGESFAEAVFGGEGLSATKDKALEFVEKSQYKKVKKQLKRFKAPSVWTKFFFPVRVPLTAVSGLLYNIALLAFFACLMLTYKDGAVKLVIFTDDTIMTVVFVISGTIIILANIHVLILLNLVLFMVVLIFAIAGAIAVFLSHIFLFVYFPLVACLGYFLLFYEAGTSMKNKYKVSNGNNVAKLQYKLDDRKSDIDIMEVYGVEIDTKDEVLDAKEQSTLA